MKENGKAVKNAFNKVMDKINKMDDKEFKKLMNDTEDRWGKLLLRGGFLDFIKKDK